MKRKIIAIEKEKCNGCGLCIDACHEGALQLVDGKAELVSDTYCDGLGDCLPECPTGAITIVEREAAPFDAEAVAAKKQSEESALPCGCPGTLAQTLERNKPTEPVPATKGRAQVSQLRQWPVQIQLVPVTAPYLNNAHLLIAADCTAFAYGAIHQDFMQNKVTLIGCPKLDIVDYAEKLTAILEKHEIKSISIVQMEVPCCSGLAQAVKTALQQSGKIIPWSITTISTAGEILAD